MTQARGQLFPRILCSVDGTRAGYAAVHQAARLAGAAGELTLLVVTAPTGGGAFSYAAVSPRRAERLLDESERIARKAGAKEIVRLVDPGSPAPRVILERAAMHNLLALGAPVRSWIGDLFLDGVAVAALGSLNHPLLAVPARAESLHPDARILVASDGTDSSDRAVEIAGLLARSDGSEIAFVHAIASESHEHPHHVQEQIRRLAAATGREVTKFIEPARPRAAIIAAVEACNPWLLVMGSRHVEGLAVIGYVSRQVVHDAPCPVLLVPPEDLTR